MTYHTHNQDEVRWEAYLALAYIEGVIGGPGDCPTDLMVEMIRKRVAEFAARAEALQPKAEAAR
jgi:hypothetical protein